MTRLDGDGDTTPRFICELNDGAQAVPDVDAAFVTIAFALPAGLTADQAILTEGTDSPYFNVLATRPELKDDARIAKLHELLLAPETAAFMTETWGGLVVPAE